MENIVEGSVQVIIYQNNDKNRKDIKRHQRGYPHTHALKLKNQTVKEKKYLALNTRVSLKRITDT